MSEDAIRETRLQKLARMRELGCDPYAVERFERTDTATGLLTRFDELQESTIGFAGRVVSYRLMGKAGFAHLGDGDGKIQAYFRKDDLGEVGWELYNLLDIGDHVGVRGELFTTKTGEKSIHVRQIIPLSKSLHALPLGKEKDGQHWYGLTDTELRYRHRHLDLICNPDVRAMLLNRSRLTSAVRQFFYRRGYFEVETPMLQFEAGGASATPFLTHYNAYDVDVKLRISLELYLKRIICGDVDKVFEIGRVFRNEGVSNRHNPEFSLLEWYEAYANLEDVMATTEDLFREVCSEVFGTTIVSAGGVEMDFSKPWQRIDLLDEIERLTGLTAEDLSSLDRAKHALGAKEIVNPTTGKRIHPQDEHHLGGLIEKLLEVFIEPNLVQPTFVIGYPLETSPLAKKDPNRPGFTRRFEGYVRGREICNAFSEINDPIDQRERFENQVRQRAEGDAEAHPMDEEFLYALESGMPPTGGCGIGMDRLAMILGGAETIREVMLFPTMKPQHQAEEEPESDSGS